MKKYTQTQKADAQSGGAIPDDMLMELIEDYSEYYKWLHTTELCHVLKMYVCRKLEEFWGFVDSRGLRYNSNWYQELRSTKSK